MPDYSEVMRRFLATHSGEGNPAGGFGATSPPSPPLQREGKSAVTVAPAFGVDGRPPSVVLQIDRSAVLLDIPQARDMVMYLLDACEEGMMDTFLIRFLESRLRFGDAAQGAALKDFRRFREASISRHVGEFPRVEGRGE